MQDHLIAIERALDVEDLETAAELAAAALAKGGLDPLIFNLVAWKAEATGRIEEAESILRNALEHYPDDPSLHLALGVTLRTQGRLREGTDAFDTAIALDPNYVAVWQERGATFERGGAITDAVADYRRAVAIEPDNASALAMLAMGLARLGEMAEAGKHADRALTVDPTNVRACSVHAMIALHDRRYDDAIGLLVPIEATCDDRGEFMIGACTLLGDAFEGAGRFDDAYQSYLRAQATFENIHKARENANTPDPQTVIDRIAASFASADKSRWICGGAVESPAATHVFLTGYPRSGTTLAENILATLPSAIAIEERPTLADVDPDFLIEPNGLNRFAALSESTLDELRAGYWSRSERAAGERVAGRLFVDMDPFKGSRLPIIARLFPLAKVILMRRDPRDVVWSCFHTNFAYNSGTAAFTTLERTARHYARTWEVIDEARRTLPINTFDLHYEDLVRNFDATTQALCAYIDVPWNEKLREFDRTAMRRGVSTASIGQVRRGLYDGSGGWRRYAKQMAMVESILAPWIERFETRN